MSSREFSPELKAIHKKFIFGNIVICIIALVAGLCMLFMPWLDLRVHIEGENLAKIISEQTTSDTTAKSSNETEALTKALADSLKGESFDIPINLYPMKILSAANGDKAEIEKFFNSVIGKDGAEVFLGDFINKLAPVVVKASLNTTIDQMFEDMEGDLTPEEKEMVEKYKQNINDALDNIADNPTAENAKNQLNSVVDSIVADAGNDMTNDDVAEMRSVIDELVNQATKDGNFDYVHLIKNLNIESIEKAINGETTPAPASLPDPSASPASASAMNSVFETTESGSADTSTKDDNPLTEVIEMLENPGSLVAESLDEDTVALLNIVFWVIFGVFIAFPVFLCFLLAILAIVRIFTQNKRVRYWYVKTILFIATLLIVALNVLAKFVLPSLDLGAEVGSILSAFSITFLGSAIVCAGCWVALTLFSLFYYRRIKKKAKRQFVSELVEAQTTITENDK